MPSIFTTMTTTHRYSHLTLAGLALLLASAGATAQPVNPNGGPGGGVAGQDGRPYTFIASQRFKQDSNLFRVKPNSETKVTETSETISSTGLGFQMNQLFSRQRVIMDLGLNHNIYRNNDHLNNTDYQTALRWDMVTGGELSGDLRWNGSQKLGDFGQATPGSTAKNLERNRVLSGRLQLGMNSLWSIEGGAAYRKLTFSSKESFAQELNATSGNAGIRYNPTDLLSLGLGYRKTKGDYFNTEESFDRNDIDFTARVAPNAISAFTGRISRTTQNYDLNNTLDSNLLTSAIGMQWRPGGSVGFDFQVLRDNNAGIGTGESTLETSTAAQAPITTALQSIVRWDITPKIVSNLTLRTSQQSLTIPDTTSTTPGATKESADRTNFYGVGVDYTPIRWLKIQGSVGQEKRSGGEARPAYSATLGAIGAEIRLD